MKTYFNGGITLVLAQPVIYVDVIPGAGGDVVVA
jgi:hypothetical protein